MNNNLPTKEFLEKSYQEICFATGSWLYYSEMSQVSGDVEGYKRAQAHLAKLKIQYHQWQGQKTLVDILNANNAEDQINSELQKALNDKIIEDGKDQRIADEKLNSDLNDLEKELSGTNG